MDRCCGHQEAFGEKTARRDLRRYRRRGPRKTTRQLLEALRERGVRDAAVLDIGGGVGVIEHELLESGAASAEAVDASASYLKVAREEARRRGQDERLAQREGDFVELADRVAPADVVTLDRVICCYPDVEALVSLSAAHARQLYGVVYPRDTALVRLVFRLFNLGMRLRPGCDFQAYVHPTKRVDALVRETGLQRSFYTRSGGWQVAVYVREA
jgi:magnesium-protoporphyrin O-methyltransferase